MEQTQRKEWTWKSLWCILRTNWESELNKLLLPSKAVWNRRLNSSSASACPPSQSSSRAESLFGGLIVGRLDDIFSRICSKCMEFLKDILGFDPAMKIVVVREVRQLIYKQSTGKIHAVFTSVVFLSQIVLSVTDASSAAVAGQLVEWCISLFDRAMQQE